jgi:hypothetical protein
MSASASAAVAPDLIELFVPRADVAECHEVVVKAPADLVFEVATKVDLWSLPLVRALFWLREKLLGAAAGRRAQHQGLLAEILALGWVRLAERPKRELVMGATARPWKADVAFTPVPPDRFALFSEPDLVKIAWTLEAEPIDAVRTRLRTQTRVLATDDSARRKFRRYWRLFGAGIVLIRWLALPEVRRQAERRFRAQGSPAPS